VPLAYPKLVYDPVEADIVAVGRDSNIISASFPLEGSI
jgi:hypothetical protein